MLSVHNVSSIIDSKKNEDTEHRKTERWNNHLIKILILVVVIEIIALFNIYSNANIEGLRFWPLFCFIYFIAALAIVRFFIEFMVENKFDIATDEEVFEQAISKMSAENKARKKDRCNNTNKVFEPKVN